MILRSIFLAASVALPPTAPRVAVTGEPVLPASIVGAWASDDARFDGEALASGSVLMFEADGTGGVIGAPPPIGVRITARFDTAASVLTVTLLGEHDKPMAELHFAYDAEAKALLPREGAEDGRPAPPYHRRSDSVPAWARRMICQAGPKPSSCG